MSDFEEKLKRLANYLGQDCEKLEQELGLPDERVTNPSGTAFLYYNADKTLFTISGKDNRVIFISSPMGNAEGKLYNGSPVGYVYGDIAMGMKPEDVEKLWGAPEHKYTCVWKYSKYGGTTSDGIVYDLYVNFGFSGDLVTHFEYRLKES